MNGRIFVSALVCVVMLAVSLPGTSLAPPLHAKGKSPAPAATPKSPAPAATPKSPAPPAPPQSPAPAATPQPTGPTAAPHAPSPTSTPRSVATPPSIAPVSPGSAVTSLRSGSWSDPAVWSTRRVPQRGESVVVAPGHSVTYDVYSEADIRRLSVSGALVFARDRHTRLDVGNVIVDRGGYLEIGTLDDPIPATVGAEIRFAISSSATCTGGTAFVEGDIGLWVFAGGRWEAHGARVRATWTKLAEPALAGTSVVRVIDDVSDWQPGAWVVVTATDMGSRPGVVRNYPQQYEEFQIARVTRRTGHTEIQLSGRLRYTHDAAAETSAEVALLSRNVVITAKYPNDEMNGHTIFMMDAVGGISYTEFRELGNHACIGRYPVHFHMMGDSSRGMRVLGASIWRSDQNFLNIHASNGVTVEDTVGYDSPGIGFFVGEAHPGMRSVDNVMVGNLAARSVYRDGALQGRHRASGFWVESHNTALIGNVASGSWGRSVNDSGFNISPGEWTQAFAPMLIVRNESHSNNGSGMNVWYNGGPVATVIDFRGWRNGFAGMKWGAYINRMQVHHSVLFENGVYNLETSSRSIYLADSVLYGTSAMPTATGLFVSGYSTANDPARPTRIFRNTFAGHRVHISQDHRPCSNSAEENNPLSRDCSAAYLLMAGNRFNGGTAFDFGWQRNANSWFQVEHWSGTASPTIGAPHFRLTRRDRPQPGPSARYYAPYDAWLNPLPAPTNTPPQATLAGPSDGDPLGATVTLQVSITARSNIERVIFYADERVLATRTAEPFSHTWSTRGWSRRFAHVYAAVVDENGNVGYTQVIRLRR